MRKYCEFYNYVNFIIKGPVFLASLLIVIAVILICGILFIPTLGHSWRLIENWLNDELPKSPEAKQ